MAGVRDTRSKSPVVTACIMSWIQSQQAASLVIQLKSVRVKVRQQWKLNRLIGRRQMLMLSSGY